MNLHEDLAQNRPLVFGHSGARAYAPMNTIPAFLLAAEQGSQGIELDIHLARDGEMVVIHDFTVDATTNGKGHVRDLTLDQLKALDAGSWFDSRFYGTQIPTLDEVFEAIPPHLFVNIEIKSRMLSFDTIDWQLAETINQHNAQERVIVSSFNPLALRRFRRVAPEIPIGFLHIPRFAFIAHSLMIGLPHEARHPHHTQIDARYMAWAKRHDYLVITWTVNDPDRARQLRDLGVDVIITDNPDIILEALGAA